MASSHDAKNTLNVKNAFDSFEKIDSHLRTSYPKKHKLLPFTNNLPLIKGNLCRLVAVTNAINYFNESKQTNCILPPMRKRPDDSPATIQPAATSLRQIAKKTTGAKIGEFYTTAMVKSFVKGLGKELKDQQIENATVDFQAKSNPAFYIEHLKQLIDKGHPAIVYYDMDKSPDNYAQPLKTGDGTTEHSALVVGYFEKANQFHFILAHMGVYSCVNGADLACAASHLTPCRTTPQTFYKIKGGVAASRWSATLEPFKKKYGEVFTKIVEASKSKNAVESIPSTNGTLTLFKRKGIDNPARHPGFQNTICAIIPGVRSK